MKRSVIAGLLIAGLASPAFAAVKWFTVVDTVGNCSVVEGGTSAGLTRIGNKDGYDSEDAAGAALAEVRKDTKQCAGVVE